ncbi:LysR family transcriptional regulator [Stenotrophomonas daejeonensis]|uniref:LysR family transcriptional regulator n=1 Tax=Stenotrophomonas daejeonensis TaxID=659018 RepID=A0A0R0E238_9GAMM|nr:LysR family transcriptional regulator [Stenotrophomonas daejeonensis]KRG88267.1 LysR family transcriptional regulator [Stenotrophomonas daejeonensis]
MENFRRMALFAQVVQHGSMSAAARALGMSTSAVSQQLRTLEREAGVALLHRSTRRLALTDVGSRYYTACVRLLDAAGEAEAELSAARHAPSGELRLSAPLGMADHIGPALGGWLRDNPQLRLYLHFEDGWTDLVQARIDLALRFGRLPDSDWMAQRLGVLQRWPCAAPEWLQRHGAPSDPLQVPASDWLGLAQVPGLAWRHRVSGQERQVPAHPRIVSHNQPAVRQLCESGLGVAVLTCLDVIPLLADGRLVRLLPEWALPPLPVWAVTPHRQTQPAKVRQAIELLGDHLAQMPDAADTCG